MSNGWLPNLDAKFWPCFEMGNQDKISSSRKNVIIIGDLNSDMLVNSGNGKKLKDILQAANFRNVIKKPTRITEHSDKQCKFFISSVFSSCQLWNLSLFEWFGDDWTSIISSNVSLMIAVNVE